MSGDKRPDRHDTAPTGRPNISQQNSLIVCVFADLSTPRVSSKLAVSFRPQDLSQGLRRSSSVLARHIRYRIRKQKARTPGAKVRFEVPKADFLQRICGDHSLRKDRRGVELSWPVAAFEATIALPFWFDGRPNGFVSFSSVRPSRS